jgi:adenosylmethionine-8-amino-7-oxononanoate aminotransferase
MLTDADGRHVYDAVSSIWTCIHGHGHPRIVEAIARQAATLDHATLLGATNPPAEALAERLAGLTGLDRVVFASDGASAIEAAIKIALQYWYNRGERARRTIVHLAQAYHGDTIGAMSVSDVGAFKEPFRDVCFASETLDAYARRSSYDDVAAIVVEPLVQATAGFRIVRAEGYAAVRRAPEPLLIVDEIATGFGRTGAMFAHPGVGLQPDILCVGKGITGGALALSATLCTERVYAAFLAPRTADRRHFFHGHSYAGNPIACAAALASLDVFAADDVLRHVAALADTLATHAAHLAAHPRVAAIRRAGLMCGIDVTPPEIGDDAATFAWRVADRLYDAGIFTRPIGNVVQFVPPPASTHAEIAGFFGTLTECLDRVS